MHQESLTSTLKHALTSNSMDYRHLKRCWVIAMTARVFDEEWGVSHVVDDFEHTRAHDYKSHHVMENGGMQRRLIFPYRSR